MACRSGTAGAVAVHDRDFAGPFRSSTPAGEAVELHFGVEAPGVAGKSGSVNRISEVPSQHAFRAHQAGDHVVSLHAIDE